MILPFITSAVLATTAALDGYWTNKAQKQGAMETGVANMIFGTHPTAKDLILKGGAVIVIEIAALLLVSHFDTEKYVGLVFSVPLWIQSVFHVAGIISGVTYKKI